MPTLNWKHHESYESARHFKGVIYLFEWKRKPFYWGIAERNSFGVRYNPGYRHLIQATLANGGKLYLAEVSDHGETPLREIENSLMVAHGYVANARVNQEGPTFDLTHRGDVPASVLAGNDSSTPDNSAVDNSLMLNPIPSNSEIPVEAIEAEWKYGITHARSKVFAYKIMPQSLIIRRGNALSITDELDGENLVALLEYLIRQSGNTSFPLENSVTPQVDRELGLGTAVQTTFNKPRGFAQVASQLSVLLCDIGALSRILKPNQVYGNRYRVNINQLPESWEELAEWLDALPINSRLAPANDTPPDAA